MYYDEISTNLYIFVTILSSKNSSRQIYRRMMGLEVCEKSMCEDVKYTQCKLQLHINRYNYIRIIYSNTSFVIWTYWFCCYIQIYISMIIWNILKQNVNTTILCSCSVNISEIWVITKNMVRTEANILDRILHIFVRYFYIVLGI